MTSRWIRVATSAALAQWETAWGADGASTGLFRPELLADEPSCVEAIAAHFPDRPIVGYESGPMLVAAQRRGFRSVGPVRVWTNDDATHRDR